MLNVGHGMIKSGSVTIFNHEGCTRVSVTVMSIIKLNKLCPQVNRRKQKLQLDFDGMVMIRAK